MDGWAEWMAGLGVAGVAGWLGDVSGKALAAGIPAQQTNLSLKDFFRAAIVDSAFAVGLPIEPVLSRLARDVSGKALAAGIPAQQTNLSLKDFFRAAIVDSAFAVGLPIAPVLSRLAGKEARLGCKMWYASPSRKSPI